MHSTGNPPNNNSSYNEQSTASGNDHSLLQQDQKLTHGMAPPEQAPAAPWEAVVHNPELARAASRIAAADNLDNLSAYIAASCTAQHDQVHHQQDGQYVALPEVPSAVAAAAGFGNVPAAGASNSDSPQLSGIGGAADEPQQSAAAADARSVPEGSENLDASGSKPVMPVVQLKVACGDMIGTLLVHKGKIIMYEGTADEKEVSPTEFERLGGRSATKKWKQSIRLIDEDGEQGRPVGEWYVMQGLEQPKKPREAKDMHPSISDGGPGSPELAGLDTRHTASSTGQGPPGQHRRPVRSTRGHAPAKHATEIAADRCTSRRGHSTRAAAAAAKAHWLEDSGSGTADSQDELNTAVAAVPQEVPWLAKDQLQQQYMVQQMQTPVMMSAEGYLQQQQQMGFQQGYDAAAAAAVPAAGVSMINAASAAVGSDEAAALSMDFSALGDWQLPPGAAAAAAGADAVAGGLLVQIPVSAPLPGDESQAVVEMTAYLEGRRAIPPWRLLPPTQRPVVGRLLVPLRQMFVMVLQAGGFARVKDDLLMWQDMAAQLGLPAWPCPDAPDPLRVLQQIYRDYLLRFESRFTLQPQSGASGGSGFAPMGAGVMQQLPTVSAATQYVSQPPVQMSNMSPCTASYCPPVGAVIDSNNLNGVAVAGPMLRQQQQQQQQQLQPQVNNTLPAALAAEVMLDDGLSGDLLDFLTDLIPDADAGQQQQQQAGDVQQSATAEGSNAQEAGAAAATATSNTNPTAGVARQHPEMMQVQQRQRLQQLQQQLQQLQQQSNEAAAGAQGEGLSEGSKVTAAASSDAGAAAGGGAQARAKRPAPLIRCGDSDLVSLMDQSEVTKLLQEYEMQQQRRQLAAIRRPNPILPPTIPSPQQQQPQQQALAMQNPSSSQLAAAIAGAVDRNMSQDLHAMMQQYWNQQQQASQRLQQQEEQQLGNLQQQTADEEMSGMLEGLQLAGATQQQQPGDPAGLLLQVPTSNPKTTFIPLAPGHFAGLGNDQLLVTPDSSNSVWPGRLLGQASVGAYLMGDMLSGNSSGQNVQLTAEGANPSGGLGSNPPSTAGLPPLPRPSSYTIMAPPAPRQQQQQSNQDELLSPVGYKEGLFRLATPSGALLTSIMDSPTLRSNPSGAGWMDVSGLLAGDSKGGTVEMAAVDGQQAGDQSTTQDDLAAVLKMW